MFGIILAETKAGEPQLSYATRQAVIRAALTELHMGLRQLPHVAPEMSAVQIQQMKLTLGQAVRELYEVEQHLDSVRRVTEARRAADPRERAAQEAEAFEAANPGGTNRTHKCDARANEHDFDRERAADADYDGSSHEVQHG